MSGFMLDTERLLASELVALASPEEAWHALMLWCRAWQQHPPASLPNDERVLMAFSRAGARWKKVRDMAMRGFVLCSDDRYYHPVLCEQVTTAWAKRKVYRNDQERLKRWREARKASNETPEKAPGNAAGNGSETRFNVVSGGISEPDRQGQGQGQKEREEGLLLNTAEPLPNPRSRGDSPRQQLLAPDARAADADFERFWSAYPRRVGKGQARRAFLAAVKKTPAAVILAGVQRAVWSPDPNFIPYPATWLNGERWRDERAASPPPGTPSNFITGALG
ncbi:MAG: DUF1376 domain-containing protein [Gemmatimonadaceae bacterium]